MSTATALAPAPSFRRSAAVPDRSGDATLHLSAAAYLDHRFRDAVVSEVYTRRDLAVAPNLTADAARILHHVHRARAIDLAEHLVLTGLLTAFFLMPSVNKFALFIGLGAWLLLGIRFRKAGASISISSRHGLKTNRAIQWVRKKLTPRRTAVAAVILFAILVLDLLTAERPAWVWLAVLGACRVAFEWLRVGCLARVPKASKGRLPTRRRTEYIGAAQHSEVIAYPRDEEPRYPGFGPRLHGVHNPIMLQASTDKDEDEDGWRAFTIAELHEHLARRVKELSADSPTTPGLSSLSISEHCFVSDMLILRPVLHLEELPASVQAALSPSGPPDHSDPPVRRELRFQMPIQGSDAVTTVFARFTLGGGVFSFGFSSCAMPATRSEYHVFRNGSLRWKSALAWCGGLALASAPADVLLSPIDLVRRGARWLVDELSGRPALQGWRPPNCGARTSIRELGTDLDRLYLELTEPLKHIKVLHVLITKALKEFLEERNIDTSGLDAELPIVINNSVVNHGPVTAGAIGINPSANVGAVGANATGTVQQQQPQGKASA